MTSSTDEAAAFVRANSALRRVPLVPEIRLHLADDVFGVWEAAERAQNGGESELPPPFWAFAWAGGQALARYVLDHPWLVAGRQVLDLGSGSGISAIAAALAGGARVLASEVDPLAVAAIGLNAAAGQVSVEVTGDVLDGSGEGAAVILAADVWYERTLAERTLGLLRRARARGASVLVGDVGRAFLPGPTLRELAVYDVPVLAGLEDAEVKRASVLTLR
ncbi:MAG TPA: 50S ribosomal protein L11 methyltransferase [Streptosporangiaceae bacterium]|nr:50S ribosomal protein L11 methyltransferase [Streptosporangiaceae bacterium]